ncbi:MAG: Xaa-Pro peptidase family protein [Hyphomicrobiales bacterium]|nr:Xaa-Pro peptidase family protein [Hyphomicrobiales bacterium]
MPGRRQAFPTAEFEQRVRNIQEAMAKRSIDLLLLHAPENIYYACGFQTSGYFAYQVLCVPASGAPRMLVRYLEQGNIHEYSYLKEYDTWKEGDNVIARTYDVVSSLGATDATIAIETNAWFLTTAIADQLRSRLPKAKFVSADQLVEKLRVFKSPLEIECVRRAGEIVSAEMTAATSVMKDGVAECEVAAAVHHAGILAGCEYTGLPHHIMSGYRYDVCHANWTNKKIVRGELTLLELYGCVERYHATQMRTFSIGKPAQELVDAARLVVDAQDDALAALKPGVSSKLVDSLVRGPIRTIRPDYYNRSGYSTGIGFPPKTAEWETLDFNEQSDWIVEEGMAFHMLALARGFGISETVVITKAGCERVTGTSPRDIIVI